MFTWHSSEEAQDCAGRGGEASIKWSEPREVLNQILCEVNWEEKRLVMGWVRVS